MKLLNNTEYLIPQGAGGSVVSVVQRFSSNKLLYSSSGLTKRQQENIRRLSMAHCALNAVSYFSVYITKK